MIQFAFYSFLLLLLTTSIGCSSPNVNAGSPSVDSAYISQPLKKKRTIDSADEIKAYGPITFGMSRIKYNKLKNWDYIQSIGNDRYLVTPIYSVTDSIYMLELKGIPKTANYYETDVKEGYNNLISVIESKYGNADETDIYPSFLQMRSGKIHFSHFWELGDKMIKIGVGETDSEYYPVCWIYSKKLKERNDQTEIKKEDTNVKSDGAKF